MLADKPLFRPSYPDLIKKGGSGVRRILWNNSAAPAPLPAWGEDGRMPLLEYAAFLLDQEAKYCQQ